MSEKGEKIKKNKDITQKKREKKSKWTRNDEIEK